MQLLVPARNNVRFYVLKHPINCFPIFFAFLSTFRAPENFRNFPIFRLFALPSKQPQTVNIHFNCQYWCPAPPPWWGTSHSRPSPRSASCRWRPWRWTPPPPPSPRPSRGTTSSANYESSPSQILSSLQTVLSVSLLGSKADSPPGVISLWPHQPCGRHGPGGPRADQARQPAVGGRGCVLSVSASGSWCCHCPQCCLSP